MSNQKEKQAGAVLSTGAIKVGYAVALCLKPNHAPLRCYVGRVQEVDDHGVRLTLLDWFVGEFSQWDFFAPWDSITSALVATPSHHLQTFGDAAAAFQTRCNDMAKGEESEEAVEQAVRQGRRVDETVVGFGPQPIPRLAQ